MVKKLLTAATLVCCSVLVHAQSWPAQWFASGTLVVGGRLVSCGKTITIYDSKLTDAIHLDGQGRMLLNPSWFAGAPPLLQFWRYGHECGHVMVGKDEAAADCWAVKYGEKAGWFSARDFPALKLLFASSAVDANHAPSVERVDAMEKCFVNPKSATQIAAVP